MSGEPRAPRVVMACDFHRHYNAMLAGALERANADVTLLTRDHDLEFGGEPGAAMDFVREATGPDVLRTVTGRVRSPRGWIDALATRRELRAAGDAYVHLQDSVGNDLRLVLSVGARRGRYALTVHDPVRHPGDRSATFTQRINRLVVRGAGLIFVHAEVLREELIEVSNPRGEIVVIPHGIDPGEAVPLPATPTVLLFGRMSYYKGLDVLLDAMEQVWRRLPEARLTVAGQGEIDPHRALDDHRVTVHAGHIPEADVPGLIKDATCVALPYRQASQSGVGSRVKPYARPLVVSDVGGLPELVSDGSGLLVPPEDPERLAGALVEVLSDRALAERLGAAGRETATREGSWDVVAKSTLEAYREHLGELR